MDDNTLLDNKISTKTVRKSTNKELLRKMNRSVNMISSKAFESQQFGQVKTFYSKNMLCTTRITPKVQPFRTRQNELVKNTQTVRNSIQKVHKKVRLVQDQQKEDRQMSSTVGENFYSGRKENNDSQNQVFITMQQGFFSNSLNATFNQFSPMALTETNSFSRYKGNLNTNRKWTFQQFLNHLYLQKAKDLRTKPNPKQQALFIERYKEKFQRFSSQQLAHEVEHGRTTSCAVRQINVPGSDFSLNAIKCICEFMLSNKIVKISSTQINSFCLVRTIILDKNPLGDEAVGILAQSLSCFKVLQKLSVVSVNMSSRGAKQLMKGLMGLEHLKHINFSSQEGLNRNRFGESTKEMELILGDSNCSWEYLNMSNSNIGQGGLSIISNGITKTTKLQGLLLSQNDIGPGDISYFMSRVKFSNLMKLDLSKNQIGDEGFKLITEVIGTQYGHNSFSRSLKVLNLSDNQIRSYGIEFYCKNMFNNNALTELQLANNNLSKGEQFFNFKYYISKNWTLKKLDLSSCFTNLQDMRHLFEGMEENRALLELKVNRNNFSVESFVAMAKMLSTNKSLKVLEMDTCNITDKFVEKSEKELREVRNIEQINFSNNYLSDKSGKILLQMANRGKSITKLCFIKNCLGIKVQNQISSVLKSNKSRKEHSRIDEKEMEYLKYVSEIQQNNEESIKSTIERLRQKEEKVKLSSLVCQVVKVEMEEENCRKQLQQEMQRIRQLEGKLMKKVQSASTTQRNSRHLPDINRHHL